jgi:hypothetical protein
MENKDYEIYKNIMSINPIIDERYIRGILQLSKEEIINSIEINEVIESNTSLVIKLTIIVNGENKVNNRLFIKTIKQNQQENVYRDMSMQEGKFYKIIKESGKNNIPVPICYDVFISDEKKEFLIVLEDISNNYVKPENDVLSEKNIWFSCAESLAKLHSSFWNSEIIFQGNDGEDNDTQSDIDCLDNFLKEFKDEFNIKIKRALEKAMEINISLIKGIKDRIKNKNNVTICNGDSHIFNFMLPTNKNKMPIIVDFQFWGEGIGTGDLAHLTRVSFSDENRKSIQLDLVEHYYKSLLKEGVIDYSWKNCLNDYRKSVASMVLIPLWQYSVFGIKFDKWIGNLQGLVDNYEYLRCYEL